MRAAGSRTGTTTDSSRELMARCRADSSSGLAKQAMRGTCTTRFRPSTSPASRRPSIDFLRREAGLDLEALGRLMHKAHPCKGGTVEELRHIRKLNEGAKARVVRKEALYGSNDVWDT